MYSFEYKELMILAKLTFENVRVYIECSLIASFEYKELMIASGTLKNFRFLVFFFSKPDALSRGPMGGRKFKYGRN
jgi:hypothetical protein